MAGITASFGLLAACADAEVAERISEDVDVIDTNLEGATRGTSDEGIVDQLGDVACAADLKTLLTAVDAFDALQGRLPASEDELVQTGLLRQASATHDVTPTGAVVPTAGSGCS
jgi:hypothetical protein